MKRYGSEIIIEVEDVIKPEKADEYKRELDVVRQQLIAIANNLIVMERLTYFPYHLFVPDYKRTFWVLTNKAFFDSTVLAFSTLWDNSSKKYKRVSLCSLKNRVRTRSNELLIENIDAEVLQILNQRIDGVYFEKSIKPLQTRIEAVRNQHIAHLDYNMKMGNVASTDVVPYRVPLDVFKEALDVSTQLFQILALGTYYQLEFWDYGPSQQEHNKLDIDEILEFVVSDSFWFSDDPIIDFASEYGKLSDKDKTILDKWRKQLGKM